jgi:hypothetical protein
MKNASRTVPVMLLSIIILGSCYSHSDTELKREVAKLVEKDRPNENIIFEVLKQFDKKAIPFLIENIDRDETGFLGFNDPNESTLYLINQNFVGLRSAYMLELLLSGENEFQIYKYGVIVKIVEGDIQMKSLTLNDMREIKKIYSLWWNANKNKSMDELKKNWKAQSILDGSRYTWV